MSKFFPRSMSLRLTLSLATIALLVSSVAGAMLFWALQREVQRQDMAEVIGKLELVSHLMDMMESPAGMPELRVTLDNMLTGHGSMQVWIFDAEQNLIYGVAPPAQVTQLANGEVAIITSAGVEMQGQRVATNPRLFPGGHLTVAIDTRPSSQFLYAYGMALILICALWIGLTALLSGWVVRRTLEPIRKLSAQAARIQPENLTLRLHQDGMDKELEELTVSFNRTLDRVQVAYEQMEEFNANVAHELRTPLTTLISGTQITLSSSRSVEDMRETLESNLEELEDLKVLVNDMLFLARADGGEVATDLAEFSLNTEIDKVADYYEASFEAQGLRLVKNGNCRVLANRGLVRRALVNLMANAVAASPQGATITLDCTHSANEMRIAVRNPGRPIKPTDLPYVFNRFYRGDGSRNSRTDGYGLGLAIVRAIARMHGGRVFASSNAEETEVGFTLVKEAKLTET